MLITFTFSVSHSKIGRLKIRWESLFVGTHMRLRVPFSQTDRNLSNESFYFTQRFVCMARVQFKNFFRLYLPIFDLLFVAMIPFLLMVFANIGIIRKTMRSNMLCVTSRKQKRNNRLTIMLLSVILAFILLTCPSVIYICLNRLNSTTSFSDTKLVVLDLLESLWYTKHALNFILYTLSGQDFRREFRKLISCSRRSTPSTLHSQRRRQQQAENNAISTHSYLSSLKLPSTHTRFLQYTNNGDDPLRNNHPLLSFPNPDQEPSMDERESSYDGAFGLIGRSPAAPSLLSITSEHGRSSA